MSIGAKIAVSAMRGIKKTGLFKGPSADLDAELRRAKDYTVSIHIKSQQTERPTIIRFKSGHIPV